MQLAKPVMPLTIKSSRGLDGAFFFFTKTKCLDMKVKYLCCELAPLCFL